MKEFIQRMLRKHPAVRDTRDGLFLQFTSIEVSATTVSFYYGKEKVCTKALKPWNPNAGDVLNIVDISGEMPITMSES